MNEEQLNELMQEVESNTSGANIDYTQIETQAQSIDPAMMDILAGVGLAINGLSILFYLAIAVGLFLINKKLGEKYPWVAFIPLVNIYSYFSASKKSWLHYLILPIIAIIVGTILSFVTFGISMLLASIYAFVMWVKLVHAISIRTGRGVGTTIGFIFVPFIMYPIVGFQMEDKSNTNQENNVSENNSEL